MICENQRAAGRWGNGDATRDYLGEGSGTERAS
jgi:hypothetical protein